MYAVQFDGPATDAGATRVVRVNRPTPGPGQLSIDVAFAGINFLDVMTRRGDPGYASGGWPLTPGLEVAGTVRELGPGTTGFRVGDPVAAMVVAGGLAQTAVADAGLVAPVPDGLDLATAAAAPLTLSTVLLLLRDAARLRAGDRLLMFGAGGGLGSVLPAVARTMGAVTLVGTASTPAKAGIAGAAGWDRDRKSVV